MDFEIVEFLNRYIHPIEEPRQWLPIVTLVIAWYLLWRAIAFQKRDKSRYYQQIEQQQLLKLLRNANRKIIFLAITTVFFSFLAFFIDITI